MGAMPTAYAQTLQTNTYDDTLNYNASYNGINDSGTTVGTFQIEEPTGRTVTINSTVLSNGGTYGFEGNTLINPTDSNASAGFNSSNQITGINNSGAIVGTLEVGNTPESFYAASAAALNSSGALGVQQIQDSFNGSGANANENAGNLDVTHATGVNDAGLIVGTNSFAAGGNDGFVYNNTGSTVDGVAAGTYNEINAAGATSTQIAGVNDAGIAVGSATIGGITEGLVYNISTGTSTAFTVPGVDATNGTFVTGINPGVSGKLAGIDEITGYTVNAAGISSGFIAVFNAATDTVSQFDTYGNGSSNVYYSGINDSGTIVGTLLNPTSGFLNGFEADIPSPGTLPLLAAGFMALGLRCRRNRLQA
jgi:hypothetical protein